jgi:hypothetical protein
LVYFSPFGPSYSHLLYFVAIRFSFWSFGMLQQEKSGNPDTKIHFPDLKEPKTKADKGPMLHQPFGADTLNSQRPVLTT